MVERRDSATGGDVGGEADRRVAAWRSSGDLLALWPDLERGRLTRAQHAVYRIVRSVLSGGARTPGLEPADEGDLRALGVAAFLSGTGPLLGRWIEDGHVRASPDAALLLARHLDHGRQRVALLHQRLARVTAALRDAGVEPVLLKGLHTGAVYFPEPGTRTGADIDLLVRLEVREAAADALLELGFLEARKTRYGARSEWREEGSDTEVRSLELDHAGNPWNLDLHTELGRWYFRGLRRDLGAEAFDSTERTTVGEASVLTLTQPHLTAFLALHASHDVARTRLVRLIELALVCRRDQDAGRLNWDELTALLEVTRTTRFVHPALALVERLIPGVVDPRTLSLVTRAASPRARRVVSAVTAAGMSPLLDPSLDAKLMWAQGVRQSLLNATELLVPSDDGIGVGMGRLLARRAATVLRGRARLRAVEKAGARRFE